jgi:L-rhamnose mutarotase
MTGRRNRHVLTLDLRDDPAAIAAYRQHHAQIWPEVVRSLEDAGVRHLEIHLLQRRLVMIVEVADGLDLRRVFERHAASAPKVAEWERLMKTLQQPAPGARPGEWWALMEQVYPLSGDSQPAAATAGPVATT